MVWVGVSMCVCVVVFQWKCIGTYLAALRVSPPRWSPGLSWWIVVLSVAASPGPVNANCVYEVQKGLPGLVRRG
jgi:hypothetical protein